MAWATNVPVVICVSYRSIVSRGVWLGDNPFHFSSPVFMGALMLGPFDVMGSLTHVVFSKHSLYIFETFSDFACMFFLFIVGLKMDFSAVTKSGRKGFMIGAFSFFAPFIMTLPLALIMKRSYMSEDKRLAKMLPVIALNECETSFHVIACLLLDLKILNSEMGRLALSCSVISNTICWTLVVLTINAGEAIKASSMTLFMSRIGSILLTLLVVVYVIRPIMLWVIKQTPEGSHVKQFYVFNIFLVVLITAFFGQATGQPVLFGPVILGMAVPIGPPLGTTIEDKLDSIVQSLLMPLFYVASAGRVQFSLIGASTFITVELFILLAFLGKLIGTMLPSLLCHMSLQDALALGLVMSSPGIMDIIHYRRAQLLGLIDLEAYSIMTCSAVVIAGITSPLVRYIYKPSTRYVTYRTSMTTSMDSEFRILACVYGELNAPSMVSLLQASNATITSPIHLYLIHLIELRGVTTPILIAHKRESGFSRHYQRSERVLNAFKTLEAQRQGAFSLSYYIAMCPYATMYDDICTLATDKRTCLIILPFHRQITRDGSFITTNPIRNINGSVLGLAPCSVGLLVDRGGTRKPSSFLKSLYSVGIIFLGGDDDREVLTYGMRMAESSNTALTLIRFCIANANVGITSPAKQLDDDLVNQFRAKFKGNERVKYKEEVVKDGIGIAKFVGLMDDMYDLMMVGRQHDRESPLVQGLTDWSEFPELGCIGDMLATSSSDTPRSILVLQQQFYLSRGYHSPSVVVTI